MTQWSVLFQKELLESWRNYKWIWVPLVFIMLGIMQPVTTYHLPQILESAGGLPDGTVIEIPTPPGYMVLAETLSQFNTLGLLVLTLAFMGTVSVERSSGVAALILVKPVSYASYITAKWASAALLTFVSVTIGYGIAYMYTIQLFDTVPIAEVLQSLALFSLWLIFIVALTILFSSLLKAQAAAAFSVLGLSVVLTLLSSMFDWLNWSPSMLPAYASASLDASGASSEIWPPVIAACLFIILILTAATFVLQRKELVQ